MWVSDETEIPQLLEFWKESNGQVWEYVCGHGMLLIKLSRPNLRRSLYIQCKDCRTIRFPSMGWQSAKLELRKKSNPKQNGEDFKFEVVDGERFYVACWGVYLLETEKAVFIDWPPESRKILENRILI
jgi:hypothetical protein